MYKSEDILFLISVLFKKIALTVDNYHSAFYIIDSFIIIFLHVLRKNLFVWHNFFRFGPEFFFVWKKSNVQEGFVSLIGTRNLRNEVKFFPYIY